MEVTSRLYPMPTICDIDFLMFVDVLILILSFSFLSRFSTSTLLSDGVGVGAGACADPWGAELRPAGWPPWVKHDQ